MMKVCRCALVFLVGCLGVLGAAAVRSQTPQMGAAIQAEVDTMALALIKERGIAGMAVAVIAPGPSGALVTHKFSYGMTTRLGGKPVTSATLFEIGSETKVFTAVLLASFAAEGRVAIDDPIQKYLPAGIRAPGGASAPITLRDLATHRSGLPRMPSNLGGGSQARSRYSSDDLYGFLNQYTLPYEPGAKFEYSNLSFGLLGTLLARLEAKSYEALIVDRIAGPLAMPDTRIHLNAEQRGRLAKGHTSTGGFAPEWNNSGALAGGGGLLSTIEDNARFLAASIDPPSLPIGLALQQVQALQTYTQEPEVVTGLGWQRINRSGSFPHDIIWKNGGTTGFSSWMGFVRETRVGVVILTNQDGGTNGVGAKFLRQINHVAHQ